MPTKRPTTAQVAARQRVIIEGIADSGLTQKQAAKRFGVTPRELETFLGLNAKQLRKRYNRSPVTRELYQAGEKHRTKQELGLKRLPRRYEYEPERIAAYATRTGAKKETSQRLYEIGLNIQRVYYRGEQGPADIWREYTLRQGVPKSVKTLDMMLAQGKISVSKYRNIMKVHAIVYAKQPKVAA